MDGLLRSCGTGCRVNEAFTMDDLADSISADTSGLRCGHVQLRIVFITPSPGAMTGQKVTLTAECRLNPLLNTLLSELTQTMFGME
ncbi:hypothetical protein DPX16_18849 [Anabarilius grahami]|uniref:Uncharacterized protein n=1 Tax=Anabarilius grahami TaxID=495550 RepID=A0A3N0Y202_ANAGA|nr:hypothetical protein DPX16_18849 [Anabarilius grahami]